MSGGEYVAGAVFFVLMLTGTVAGAALLTGRRYPQLTGAARAVGFSLIASLGILAVHLLPAMLGVLSRWTVLAATVAWLAGAWWARPVAGRPDPAPEAARPSGMAAWVLSALALAAVSLFALLILRNLLTSAAHQVDWLNFHGPGIAAWIQHGSIWQIDVYLADLAPGHYPNNGDVFVLATVLPWREDFLAHFAMWPFFALTGLTVYALAAELRAPRAAAAAAAAGAVAMPIVLVPTASGGLVDPVMYFSFLAGILFLLRHWRNGSTAELVLAGLALGLSFGTKWYAVTSVAIVIGVWAVAMLVARRGVGTMVRQGLGLTGLTLLAGGVWLLRNLIETSNPVFPLKVELLGQTVFDAPHDPVRAKAGWTIAHYFDQPSVWKDTILPQYGDALAWPAALAIAGALVALVVCVWRRRGASLPLRGVAIAGFAAFVLLTIAYVVTPYTAAGPEGLPLLTGADARYWGPGLFVAFGLMAWASGAWKRGPVILSALALIAVIEAIDRSDTLLQIDFRTTDAASVVLLFVAIAAVGIAVVPALLPLQGAAERRAVAALGLLAAIVLVAGGYAVQDRFSELRYVGVDPVADALRTTPSGSKVGLAGTWGDVGIQPPLVAFGPRFRNDVAYIGRPDRGVFRRFRTRPGFERAVGDGDYDYLVIGRGRADPPPKQTREDRWAKAAGYKLVVQGGLATLYRRG